MPKVLAWFITFNFVNIAWIFFRAKEWNDAVKVLGAMFSLQNIVLPYPLISKLSFLKQYGVGFGNFLNNIYGGPETIVWMFIGFILILVFDNTNTKMKAFNPSLKQTILIATLLSYVFITMRADSEFLYFNF